MKKLILVALILAFSVAGIDALYSQVQVQTTRAQNYAQRSEFALTSNATQPFPIDTGNWNHAMTFTAPSGVSGLTVAVAVSTGGAFVTVDTSTVIGATIRWTGIYTQGRVTLTKTGSGSVKFVYTGNVAVAGGSGGSGESVDCDLTNGVLYFDGAAIKCVLVAPGQVIYAGAASIPTGSNDIKVTNTGDLSAHAPGTATTVANDAIYTGPDIVFNFGTPTCPAGCTMLDPAQNSYFRFTTTTSGTMTTIVTYSKPFTNKPFCWAIHEPTKRGLACDAETDTATIVGQTTSGDTAAVLIVGN